MAKNTSENSKKYVNDMNVKGVERVRCVLCGKTVPFEQMTGTYLLEALLMFFGGRGRIKWQVKQEGYIALKKYLASKLESILDHELSPDDGCDYYPACENCPRDKSMCPNEDNWTGRTIRISKYREMAREMRSQGKTLAEIQNEFERQGIHKSQRQIQRYYRRDNQ